MAKWMNSETISMAGDTSIIINGEDPLSVFKTIRKY